MDRHAALPFSALLTATALGTLLVVQTKLACTDKVSLTMPSGSMPMMPGMDMSGMDMSGSAGTMMVCPVVLTLGVLSLVLTAAALALLWRDPHRSLALRAFVASLAGLPLLRTTVAVALVSAGAVAAMVRIDGMGPSGPAGCATVLALLLACSVSAALFASVAGRIALAFSRRLIVAILHAVACASGPVPPHLRRCLRAVTGAGEIPLLARGRGFRAPPSFVH